jgi:hypothetical protein
MVQGYLFCLTNEAFPDLVRIATTSTITPEQYKDTLYSHFIPTPYKVQYAKFVENPNIVLLTVVNEILKQGTRIVGKEQTFQVPLDYVQSIFRTIEGEDVLA